MPDESRGDWLGKTDYNFEWDAKMYDGNDWAGRKPGQPFFMQVQLAGGKLRGGDDGQRRRLVAARRAANSALPTKPDDVDAAAVLSARPGAARRLGRVSRRRAASPTSTSARCSPGWKQEGLLDNTLVFFMTDHGISHARGKQFLYDEGTHVPFVVRGPGIAEGAVRDDLIEHIDLAAISLAAAGIADPARRCRAAMCWRRTTQPRDAVFAARDRCDETVERIRSVRTDRFLYIRNFYPAAAAPAAERLQGRQEHRADAARAARRREARPTLRERLLFAPTRPAEELYDWTTDRWQVQNLADDPAHQQHAGGHCAAGSTAGWTKRTTAAQSRNGHVRQRHGGVPRQGESCRGKEHRLMKQWAAEGK